MEEKSFKVGDLVVVLNPEAFTKIIVRKPACGYQPRVLDHGTVLRVNRKKRTMELAIRKRSKAERWWYLVVKITTYIDNDRIFSDHPLGINFPLPSPNFNN